MTGVLLVDKPEDISSAGVIRVLKPRLGEAKVGHAGTLDPFASGLLPLCVGEATKLVRFLLFERKAYSGVIRLGAETDTLDRTGEVVNTALVPALSPDQLVQVAAGFRECRSQRPPMYSAIKRSGVPLYTLARKGLEVERAERPIEIHALTLHRLDADRVAIEVECSKGTYIRVLAADIGRAMGTVAHLESLRRVGVGRFRVAEAVPLATLLASSGPLPLLSLEAALGDLPSHRLDAPAIVRLRQGQQDPLRHLPAPRHPDDAALVLDVRGGVAGVIESAPDGTWRVARLLAGD